MSGKEPQMTDEQMAQAARIFQCMEQALENVGRLNRGDLGAVLNTDVDTLTTVLAQRAGGGGWNQAVARAEGALRAQGKHPLTERQEGAYKRIMPAIEEAALGLTECMVQDNRPEPATPSPRGAGGRIR